MRRNLFPLLILLISVFPTHWAFSQGPAPALHQRIHAFMQENRVSGMAMGFITPEYDGFYTFGYRDQARQLPVEENTYFGLGQLSQVFTTALMVDMYYEGKVNLYQPLCEYVSPLIQVPQYMRVRCNYESLDELEDGANLGGVPILGGISCISEVDTPVVPVTLCRMATHFSGLGSVPRKVEKYMLSAKVLPEKHAPQPISQEALIEKFSLTELISKPGSEFRYSNWGMAMVGHILAGQSTQGYSHLLKERITLPLEMHSTHGELEATEKERLSVGYSSRGKAVAPLFWEGMAPALGLYSTPQDMMQFLRVMMGQVNSPITAAIEECQVPHGLVGHKKLPDLRTGYGWWVLPMQKGEVYRIWAEGCVQGFSSYIGLIPEKNVAVFFLANKSQKNRQLGEELLTLLSESLRNSSNFTDRSTK